MELRRLLGVEHHSAIGNCLTRLRVAHRHADRSHVNLDHQVRHGRDLPVGGNRGGDGSLPRDLVRIAGHHRDRPREQVRHLVVAIGVGDEPGPVGGQTPVRVAPFLHIELGICETGRPGCVRLDDAARDRPLRLEVHDEVESLSRAVDAGNRFANTIHHPRSAGGRQYEAPLGHEGERELALRVGFLGLGKQPRERQCDLGPGNRCDPVDVDHRPSHRGRIVE